MNYPWCVFRKVFSISKYFLNGYNPLKVITPKFFYFFFLSSTNAKYLWNLWVLDWKLSNKMLVFGFFTMSKPQICYRSGKSQPFQKKVPFFFPPERYHNCYLCGVRLKRNSINLVIIQAWNQRIFLLLDHLMQDRLLIQILFLKLRYYLKYEHI